MTSWLIIIHWPIDYSRITVIRHDFFFQGFSEIIFFFRDSDGSRDSGKPEKKKEWGEGVKAELRLI